MEEKLDDFYAVRVSKSIADKVRNLPRVERHKLSEQIRKQLEKASRHSSPAALTSAKI
jgi:mRNA-degrading endonuclease RelE of RelBE toxin-antitoxin system